MEKRYTGITKIGNYRFIYDNEDCSVVMIAKWNKECDEMNAECEADGYKPMFKEIIKGYYEIDRVGLRKENWKNKEARMGYLEEYIAETEEFIAYEMAEFRN